LEKKRAKKSDEIKEKETTRTIRICPRRWRRKESRNPGPLRHKSGRQMGSNASEDDLQEKSTSGKTDITREREKKRIILKLY